MALFDLPHLYLCKFWVSWPEPVLQVKHALHADTVWAVLLSLSRQPGLQSKVTSAEHLCQCDITFYLNMYLNHFTMGPVGPTLALALNFWFLPVASSHSVFPKRNLGLQSNEESRCNKSKFFFWHGYGFFRAVWMQKFKLRPEPLCGQGTLVILVRLERIFMLTNPPGAYDLDEGFVSIAHSISGRRFVRPKDKCGSFTYTNVSGQGRGIRIDRWGL